MNKNYDKTVEKLLQKLNKIKNINVSKNEVEIFIKDLIKENQSS